MSARKAKRQPQASKKKQTASNPLEDIDLGEVDKIMAALRVASNAIISEAPGSRDLMAAQGCLRMGLEVADRLRDQLEERGAS